MTKYKNVWGWAGVSTKEQAKSEKESIPAQKREIEAAARRLGVHLSGILEVPGFSRDYIDFHECRDEMLAAGHDAFARLEDLWKRRAIDLFIVRDADRFGRTISILTNIGAHLVEAGAEIYLTSKNIFIDKQNYPTLITLFGLMAQDEVIRLKARHDMGMAKRFEDDLSGSRAPISHIVVKEGDRRRMVLDHQWDRFWDDLKEIFLSGMGYAEMVKEMAARGHRNKDGRPFVYSSLRKYMLHPYTWGHMAVGYHWRQGHWGYDESLEVPEGITIHRNRIEPVWTGEDAERIQAELRRRADIGKGKGRPADPHRFTGLLVCAECEYGMTYNPHGTYYCVSRWVPRFPMVNCSNVIRIREGAATQQINEYLKRGESLKRIDDLFSPPQSETVPAQRLADIAQEMAALDKEIDRLINQLSRIDASLIERYQKMIDERNAHLQDLSAEQRRLQRMDVDHDSIREQRHLAWDHIVNCGVDGLFKESNTTINQTLHMLMGFHRFLVRDGVIVDTRRYSCS